MKTIMIFSGTTEGRTLAEFLIKYPVKVYVSVATEYGKHCMEQTPLPEGGKSEILTGRMDEPEIRSFLEKKQVDLVVDATHPFATIVTQNIKKAAAAAGVLYIRCLREASGMSEVSETSGTWEASEGTEEKTIIWVESVRQAVEYLRHTEGNILISTGSKELKAYTEIPDYRNRCYARVLSTAQAVEDSARLGFEGSHLIAMQGPFSVEMNAATLRQVDAAYFVTKESGKAGGFGEKKEAALQTGATLVVIGRPKEEGKSLSEVREMLGKELT